MFNGVTLSSNERYVSIFDDVIKHADDLSYYACRAPNQECVLVVLSREKNLAEILERIELCRKEFMESMNLPFKLHCSADQCHGCRSCILVDFLPKVIVDDYEKSKALVLNYNCVDFGKTVLMKKLAKHYYISVVTAYRLFVSFTTLIDWLIRLRLLVEISIDNLIVDLTSSFITLIDWSKVKVANDILTTDIVKYYQQIAQIVVDLSGANYDESGWHSAIPAEDKNLMRIFELLQQIINFEFEVPLEAADAISYIAHLQEQREYLIPRLMNILIDADIAPGQPLYEIASKE